MTEVVHVVGLQGVGRSTLIESMAARAEARGSRTGHVVEGCGINRSVALAMFPAADVIYVERYRREDVEALPGELIISMERISPASADSLPAATSVDPIANA